MLNLSRVPAHRRGFLGLPDFDPHEAFDALSKIIANPDDTEQAFRVVRAFDGGSFLWLWDRMKRDPVGKSILRDRPSLLAALRDRDALERMPEGSLGRAYLAFCDREGITPGGLVDSSEAARVNAEDDDPELRYLSDRLRDSHDLWHLVTGHRTDLQGELAVLAFSAVMTRGPGIALLVIGGLAHSFTLPPDIPAASLRRVVQDALRQAMRAKWFPAVRWEDMLARPIEEVRIELGITHVPVYRPFYTKELRELEARVATAA